MFKAIELINNVTKHETAGSLALNNIIHIYFSFQTRSAKQTLETSLILS